MILKVMIRRSKQQNLFRELSDGARQYDWLVKVTCELNTPKGNSVECYGSSPLTEQHSVVA